MAINVKTANFEGPFDLLLHLVKRNKIDVGTIQIASIADQYLAEVSKMVILDTETASDFMLVAATLIEIKTKSMLPTRVEFEDEEQVELTPLQLREQLVEKLICYKQFKNAAIYFRDVEDKNFKFLSRDFGATSDFAGTEPNFLRNLSKEDFAKIAAERLGRKDQFLLASEHIASKPLNVEVYVETILSRLKVEGEIYFSKLVKDSPKREIIVVTLLAVLELYKRNLVDVVQDSEFEDFDIIAKKAA